MTRKTREGGVTREKVKDPQGPLKAPEGLRGPGALGVLQAGFGNKVVGVPHRWYPTGYPRLIFFPEKSCL